MLVDDESRNGSYLNGKRIRGRHALRDGDVLRFGDTVVLFRAPVPDEGGPGGGLGRAGAGRPRWESAPRRRRTRPIGTPEQG